MAKKKSQDLPVWVKSWKAWGIVVGTLAATISLAVLVVQLSQPLVEYYSTRSLRSKVDSLALNLYSFKQETIALLEDLKNQRSTQDQKAMKELVRLTVLALENKPEVARGSGPFPFDRADGR